MAPIYLRQISICLKDVLRSGKGKILGLVIQGINIPAYCGSFAQPRCYRNNPHYQFQEVFDDIIIMKR
jgi:hypothetical protein